jgi:hypothetical protein
MNSCGTCTLCCCLTEVPELKKPLTIWCNYCNKEKGCTIYEQRPESCRSFQCVWLKDKLHASLRPDICHVLFEQLPIGPTFLALVDKEHKDAWKIGMPAKLISEFLTAGFGVVISIDGGNESCILPPKGKTKEEVYEDIKRSAEIMNYKGE